MLVLQIISVLIVAHVVVMARSVKEQSLSHIKSLIKKREAIELIESGIIDQPMASLLFAAANLTRSHHYWTRKRGRPTADPDDYYYYQAYRTTRRSLRSSLRQKRNIPKNSESTPDSESPEVTGQISEPTRASSILASTSRSGLIEVNLNDPNVIATERTTEGPLHLGPTPHDRSKPRKSRKRLGPKL